MSFTGIGRIGSQRILNVGFPANTDNYFYSSPAGGFWSTHPINYNINILGGAPNLSLKVGSKIVTGGGTQFTLLCNDFQLNSTPEYKYIIGWDQNTGENCLLEIDYVISDEAMMLKFPAFADASVTDVYPIDYFNSMILKEVNINTQDPEAFFIAKIISKYGLAFISTYLNAPYKIENEGGVEPVLIQGDNANVSVILNY